jgi:hypothetical protein
LQQQQQTTEWMDQLSRSLLKCEVASVRLVAMLEKGEWQACMLLWDNDIRTIIHDSLPSFVTNTTPIVC